MCVIHLTILGVEFYGQWNDFQFDQILRVQPNTHQGIKYFPKIIFSQNKQGLIWKSNAFKFRE